MTAQGSDTGRRDGIAGGVILIGIGMLALTGWWWPGIMLVVGCGLAAERLLRGEFVQAVAVFTLFLAIPIGVSLLQRIDIPWSLVGPFVLVAVGLAIIVRAVTRT